MPGAFADATRDPSMIMLFRAHDHSQPNGRAVAFTERPDGLHGVFVIRDDTAHGEAALLDVRGGYLPAMSVGFRAVQTRRGPHGETLILSAVLKEVSLVTIGAYDGAKVLALRQAAARTPARGNVHVQPPRYVHVSAGPTVLPMVAHRIQLPRP